MTAHRIRTAWAAAAGLWLVCGPARAVAPVPALAPDDFAWGRAIETQRTDPLQTLLLDLSVYRGALGPDLADVRVFNGAGEVVPHAIRPLVDPHEQEGARVPVPLFRVPDGSALAQRAVAGPKSERARDVAIEIAADGAIVRVGPEAATAAPAPQRPAAYLLDLSQLDRAAVGLDLVLAPEPAEFAVALRVEASDDLVHFAVLDAHAALARLDQAGHRIERSRVELPGVSHRYLLLSGAGPLPVELMAARAQLAPVVEPPPRQRERIAGMRAPDERAEFVFDLGGAIPVDRVQVDLPVANTVIEAQLYSAYQPDGPWLLHFAGVLYQLERPDGALRNAELTVPPIRRRYFKLAVAEKGGGLGGGAPALEVAWVPEQLAFVARGAGPFALGYGRAQTEPERFDAAELIQSALPPNADLRTAVPRETARLGPVHAVGDPSVLGPRSEPTPPRTIALWAVLVASVAVVLALSLRLVRRTGSPERRSSAK
jgi:uncharacterized protein DUF3999